MTPVDDTTAGGGTGADDVAPVRYLPWAVPGEDRGDDDVPWVVPGLDGLEADAASAPRGETPAEALAPVITLPGVASLGVGDDLGETPEMTAETRQRAAEQVVASLARHDRSRSELARMLRDRDVAADVIETVLDDAERQGLVDDVATATRAAETLQRRKHLGARGVRSELQRRGFGAEVIDAAVEESEEPDDDLERARDILRTKTSSWARLDPETRTRRAQALLQRRGYDWSIIGPVVAELGRPASSGGPRFS